MIDTNEKSPGRAPKKDMTALSNALRENLRRRKVRAPAASREDTREERAPAQSKAPEDEAKWTR
jgi:hypothetical protein